jgi:small subunit ribosomal protein S30e
MKGVMMAQQQQHLACTQHLCVRALPHTGKVHGSLARAGKVRGQTPKVPKQEKKKKPTGRAMKRIKYNRRFVNVGACVGWWHGGSLWWSGGQRGSSSVAGGSWQRPRQAHMPGRPRGGHGCCCCCCCCGGSCAS